MTRAPDRDLQALLAEEPFVRGLACALASNDADDVAQQTFLMALQHRGPVQQPRSWLHRVATNVAKNLARAERRRGQRERTAAARERVPSSAELMEREERRSALVRAVDRLPVELREVVLLRWFEGLPPRRIAVALGLPVTTVWNRLRSALQRLREGLDREHGGDRRAWLLPLLPLRAFPGEAGPALPVLLAGGCAMTTKSKMAMALGVLLLLAGGYALWPDRAVVRTQVPPDASQDVTASSGSPSASVPADGAATGSEREVVPATAGATTGSLLVRVIRDGDRSPVATETLVLAAKGADQPAAEQLHRTDQGGVVRVDGLAPGHFLVHLLQYPRSEDVEIKSGLLTEFECVAPAGLTVNGLVVDADDRPVAGAEVGLVDFNSSNPATVATTDGDGRFAVRHVSPLSLIGARSAHHAASRLQMLRGPEGAAVDVKIQLTSAGGALEGTVWGPDGRPMGGAVVQVGSEELEGPVTSLGVSAVAVPVRTDAAGRFRAVGLKPGEQRVFVRSQGHAAWQGQCFIAAQAVASLRVDLVAGVTVRGVVRDAAGASAVGAAVTSGRGREGNYTSTETASDGSFTLTGLPTGDLEVRASHPQLGRTKAMVAGRAGATVTCELILSRGIELRGRVVDQNGAGVSDVDVHAFGDGAARAGSSGSTDAEGRFSLGNCPAGLLRVTASAKRPQVELQHVELQHVDPQQGEVELRLRTQPPPPPASARIRGQVIGPDGRGLSHVTVGVFKRGGEDRSDGVTGGDGTFALGPVRPGFWQVYVPPQRLPGWSSEWRELAADAIWDVGRVQLADGGAALVEVLGAKAGAEVDLEIRLASGGFGGGQWVSEHLFRTAPLVPGEHRLLVASEGCARRSAPLSIRAGEEVRLQVRLEPGIRQRLEFVRGDGAKVSSRLVHALRSGDEVLIRMGILVYWKGPPVYAADGAMTAALWLAPGKYQLDAAEADAAGSAEFTVGESEGPPVRIVLR